MYVDCVYSTPGRITYVMSAILCLVYGFIARSARTGLELSPFLCGQGSVLDNCVWCETFYRLVKRRLVCISRLLSWNFLVFLLPFLVCGSVWHRWWYWCPWLPTPSTFRWWHQSKLLQGVSRGLWMGGVGPRSVPRPCCVDSCFDWNPRSWAACWLHTLLYECLFSLCTHCQECSWFLQGTYMGGCRCTVSPPIKNRLSSRIVMEFARANVRVR